MTDNIKIKIRKNPTVTVAVSALNEEKNISAFLSSVLSQKENGFILEKILVVSDGSADRTAEIAESFGDPRIEVVLHRKRKGKAFRLNEIYAELESDILVQSDADVIFAHPFVLGDVVEPIINDAKIGLCGGNPMPAFPKTFTEKAVFSTTEVYGELRKLKNIFSADGKLLALKKEFAKSIRLPNETIADDAYIYFKSVALGYAYRFAESAVVVYRLPQNIRDHVRQNTRFISVHAYMGRYFPENLLRREYDIDPRIVRKLMLNEFLKHPALCLYIFILNRYCKLRSVILGKTLTSRWGGTASTKSLQTP